MRNSQGCAETDPVPITGPGGTHELFLVFTNPDAGTQSLLGVDVLRFRGKGGASTTRPEVAITSPADGSQVDEGQVTVTADASDAGNQVASVEFFADGGSIGTDTEAPYSAAWTAQAGIYTLTAKATNDRGLSTTSQPVEVTVGDIAVKARWKSFASTTASFFQFGEDRFVIDANGADTWTGEDEYGAIYQDALVGERFDARVKLVSQENASVWGKAGIMAKNDMTQAGASAGYAMMAATPGNGYAFQWDGDGNGFLEVGSTQYPSWLRLQRDGSVYAGYYSADGEQWVQVGSAEVASPAATQDLGMFSASHASGTQAASEFEDFTFSEPFVSASAEPAEGIVPLDVHFRADATVEDATFSWDFGDGATSAEQNPRHTYTDPGTYTATVTARRPGGETSSSSVTVKAIPDCGDAAEPDPFYRMLYDNTNAALESWNLAGPGGFELQPDCSIMSVGGLGLLWYDEEFHSPHTIKLDWKMAGDDNSGVFVGFPNPGTDPWVAVNEGYEMQIDATDDPDSTTGAVYNFQAPDSETRDRVLNPPGEWNRFEITVDDPRIVVKLNGEVINELTSTDPNRDLSSGYVGIQNHGSGDEVFFRNIQVWTDRCPDGYSPDRTVRFGDSDSGVPNYDRGDGCTVLDLIYARAPFRSHGQFVRAVQDVTRELRGASVITDEERERIITAAGEAA